MAKQKTRSGRGVAGRPGRRYELTDEAWERIDPLPPRQGRGGRWNDHRTTLNGVFWILNSGAPWRDTPSRYGRWESVYGRYRRWTREGLYDRVLHRLIFSWTRKGSSIGPPSMSTGRTSVPTDPPQEAAKRGRNRTRQPRPGTIPRRLFRRPCARHTAGSVAPATGWPSAGHGVIRTAHSRGAPCGPRLCLVRFRSRSV